MDTESLGALFGLFSRNNRHPFFKIIHQIFLDERTFPVAF
jgi:hypothetical protein